MIIFSAIKWGLRKVNSIRILTDEYANICAFNFYFSVSFITELPGLHKRLCVRTYNTSYCFLLSLTFKRIRAKRTVDNLPRVKGETFSIQNGLNYQHNGGVTSRYISDGRREVTRNG